MINHYKRLGVEKDATKKEIREAFMFLAGFLSPDSTNTGFNLEERKEKYRGLVESFKALTGADRGGYDRELERGQAEDTPYILGETMIITDTFRLKEWLEELGRKKTIEERVDPYNQEKDERGIFVSIYA